MRYTRLATYKVTNGTFPEIVGMAERGILPIFTREPGFVDYGLVDAGPHKVVSISIWETHEQAQKATTVAETWVKANMADRLNLETNYVGDLALFHGVPVTAA